MPIEFDIDVSGEDLLSEDYTICIADKNNVIVGYKFDEETIKILKARQGDKRYKYGLSKQWKVYFKVRLYCTVIYYLFNNIKDKIEGKDLILNICKDFQGHEKDITSNLLFMLRDKLGLKFNIRYLRLPKESNADKYAGLMREDTKNQMRTYVRILLKELEEFLV
jgi:hypothetical protein